jgi:putative colanic acid biosynthesis acetyltransferase WcaF
MTLPDLSGTRPTVHRRLREFTGSGYDKGRSVFWQVAWFATANLIFTKWWLPPSFRPIILRVFGASVGERVLIRHGVKVQWPWKLAIGSDVWIGECAWLLNLEDITIADDVCISQDAFLCTGGHDPKDPTFSFDNARIVIGSGVWVGAKAVILRGTSIDPGTLVPAGAVVHRSSVGQ